MKHVLVLEDWLQPKTIKHEPEYLARQNCPKQKIWNSRMTCTTKLETAKMFFCPTHQPTHVGQKVFSVHLVLQYMY